MSIKKDLKDYPLKIIEMDDFLLNSDDLLQNRENFDDNFFSNDCKESVDEPMLTLLFIDSEKYKKHCEKTHIKLKNNIVVLDR